MKTWIVSSLDVETIQGEETDQGRKLYEEILYFMLSIFLMIVELEIVCITAKLYIIQKILFHCNEYTWTV